MEQLPGFPLEILGKGLIILGIIIILIGVILLYGIKIPFIGRLPGDIYIQKGNFIFYFPLTTCIVISVIIYIAFKFFRR
ncbi:MAG: DUF2905 domain-containing protein [Patescibacteria group bacterium]|nr:DUF2905 domain-containing protein [Patescibacteria group bacterium]